MDDDGIKANSDFVTRNFLHPALEAAGVEDPERYVVDYSTAWCAPSENLWDMFHLPMPDLIYPDDCGQPHKWERMAINESQCGCLHCGAGITRWLECSECLTSVHEKDDPEGFGALWEPAPWG